MAKRKRLTPATPATNTAVPADLETKSSLAQAPIGVIPKRRAPIADVASDAAATSALQKMADQMDAAKNDGRIVVSIPHNRVDGTYLLRDRVTLDAGEMDVLKSSLTARGQQTPIEVVALDDGRYGLISGFRRLTALRELHKDGQGPDTVLALIRTPSDASEAYTAMVEENEVRVGLSYFERANIVVRSVEKGVFPHERAALSDLFASASRSKRSKIKSFLPVVRGLGPYLAFPNALGERLGLALAARMEDAAFFAKAVKTAKTSRCETAEEELAMLQNLIAPQGVKDSTAAPRAAKPAPSINSLRIDGGPGRIELSGLGVTQDMIDDLTKWFAKRGVTLKPKQKD